MAQTLGDNRTLEGVTAIWTKYRGVVYTGQVVNETDEQGNTQTIFRVSKNGETRDFKSPSSAGPYIRDGKATNGWSFWHPGEPPIDEPKEKKAPKAPKQPRKPKATEGDEADETEDAEEVESLV